MSLDLTSQLQQLSADLLSGLRADLLGHITDPTEIDLISRNTAKIAAAGISLVGATGDALAQAQQDYNSAIAVLATLASAAVEDEANAQANAIAKLATFAQSFLAKALTAAIEAIPLAAI